jgi:tetratricopeptide (TPR) repeat protein
VSWCKPLIATLLAVTAVLGSTNLVDPIVRAEQIYLQARIRYEQDAANVQNAWQLGQACFELADVVDSNSRRAKLANEGIDACKAALQIDPKLAPAQYYLALNVGQLARTKSIGALKLVSHMESGLKLSIRLDPEVDFAGPHRSLGLLYRDAPGWPVSIGSRGKARQHLQKAVELRPDFPENWICLLESYSQWSDKRALQSHIKKVDEILAAARQKYNGESWAAAWQDWERRWSALLKQFPPAP